MSSSLGGVLALLLYGAAGSTAPHTGEVRVEAVTKPYADVALSFVGPGRVASVLVKEGERVKPDQLLARQEDEVEQVRKRILAAQAADQTRVSMAEVDLEQKRGELRRIEWAKQNGATTEREVDQARLAVRMAELTQRQARFEHEQDQRRHDEARAQLERMRIYSPLSGVVEMVGIETGEAPEALTPLIRVVQLDPLVIDVPFPLAELREFSPRRESPVQVRFPGSSSLRGEAVLRGVIRNISGVADAASDTLRIRVEVPNPGYREAGERVTVTFTRSAGPRAVGARSR